MRFRLILLFVFVSVLPMAAQKEYVDVKRGNRQYNKEQFVDAENNYRKGLAKDSTSYSGNFNLGNAYQ